MREISRRDVPTGRPWGRLLSLPCWLRKYCFTASRYEAALPPGVKHRLPLSPPLCRYALVPHLRSLALGRGIEFFLGFLLLRILVALHRSSFANARPDARSSRLVPARVAGTGRAVVRIRPRCRQPGSCPCCRLTPRPPRWSGSPPPLPHPRRIATSRMPAPVRERAATDCSA